MERAGAASIGEVCARRLAYDVDLEEECQRHDLPVVGVLRQPGERLVAQPFVQLLRNLRYALLFEPDGGIPESVYDLLRQTFAHPDPNRLDTSCLASSHILAGAYTSRWGLESKTCSRSLSNSPTSVLVSTTNRKPLAAYAIAPPHPTRVGDKFLDQLLFGQTRRTSKLRQTLLRFSQCNPKLLRITPLPDRNI